MTELNWPTRRALLVMLSGASIPWVSRLAAGDSEFWNKKDPSQWSSEEVERMKTKSPWAKEVGVAMRPSGSSNAGGFGYPGGGMGGGMGRGRRGGMAGPAPVQYHGVVRWASAKPIEAALKSPLPQALVNDYVISVSGIPIVTGDRQHSGNDSDSTGPSADVLDRIRDLTYLEPKGKPPAQPGKVLPGSAGFENNVLLFGFSRDLLQLSADDREVTFITQLGKLEIKTKFDLRQMTVHKELAL